MSHGVKGVGGNAGLVRAPAPKRVTIGFEVGTGKRVEIPVAHMVVTGQTQLSGKTTTLEALISRAGRRALAFVTKRGEGAFSVGRPIDPYLRDRGDWQYVTSILESQLRERMKFERSWIMKACKGARSLADVRDHLELLSGSSKRAMDADVFMMLSAYLEEIVPLLAQLPRAPEVDLHYGLNVMDLRGYPERLQGLLVASSLEWVYQREAEVISVVPEAWKYIPRGRSGPVKLAAAAIAREGLGIGNVLWIDVQDIAGADYEVLRQAAVWVLGVQRERNEVKRTIEQIPAGTKKPRPEDVTSLQVGHFIVCTPAGVRRVYVQPAWLDEDTARRVAKGDEASIPAPPKAFRAPRLDLKLNVPPGYVHRVVDPGIVFVDNQENEMSKEDVEQLGKKIDTMARGIIDSIEGLAKTMRAAPVMPAGAKVKIDLPPGSVREAALVGTKPAERRAPIDQDGLDAMVDLVVARLGERAPAILRVMVTRPELEVEVVRETVRVDGKTLRGRVARLIAEGFFESGKRNGDLCAELARQGFQNSPPNSVRELKALAEMGLLTVEGDRFKAAPGAVARVVEK